MYALQSFTDLALEPQLTMGSGVLIAAILLGTLWASLQVKLTTPTIMWFFILIAFVFHVIIGIQFIFFWIAILMYGASLVMGMVVWVAYGTRI